MSTTIQSLLDAVTQAQVDRCSRIIDENTGKVFYKVQSESDETVEYTVRFTERGWSCTCPAGQEGFHNCSHGTCKHCRWAHRHAQLYRLEQAEQSQIESLVRQGCSRDEATRIIYANAHPFHYTEQQIKIAGYDNQREPFSILR